MNDNSGIWKVFWKRYGERYPVAYFLENKTTERVQKMWADVSPSYEMPLIAVWSIEKGYFKSDMLGFLMLGAIGETMFETLTQYILSPEYVKTLEEKILVSAKKAIQTGITKLPEQLLSFIECPKCKHPNDPSAKYCNQCGTEVTGGD